MAFGKDLLGSKIAGQTMKNVDIFKYLGIEVDKN